MNRSTEDRRFVRLPELGINGANNTGKHISHPAGGHSRIAAADDIDHRAFRGNHGSRPLQQYGATIKGLQSADSGYPIRLHLRHRAVKQPSRFARMRRQDLILCRHRNPMRQQIQRVGVQNPGFASGEDLVQHLLPPGALADPRATDND